MQFYSKVENAKPTKLMEEQCMLGTLEEVSNKLKDKIGGECLKYAWSIDGRRLQTLMAMHQSSRCVVVSSRKEF